MDYSSGWLEDSGSCSKTKMSVSKLQSYLSIAHTQPHVLSLSTMGIDSMGASQSLKISETSEINALFCF